MLIFYHPSYLLHFAYTIWWREKYFYYYYLKETLDHPDHCVPSPYAKSVKISF